MWIFLVLLYGVFKGLREVCKKKAMEISTPLEVLLIYSLISFLLVIPDFKNALGLPLKFYGLIAIKSFVIFVAWIFSFKAIKKLPISLFGVLDLSRVLFATFLGVFFLGEVMSPLQIAGLILVCIGLISLRFKKQTKTATVSIGSSNQVVPTQNQPQIQAILIIMAFASCALNALSGFMDKIFMRYINSSQLQFWYMLFLVLFYFIYALFAREKINFIRTVKNKWVWILSILFVIADRALFIANANPESRVTVMTLIKQSGSIVTILSGRFIFKEKGTGHKLICAAIIITGIVLGVI